MIMWGLLHPSRAQQWRTRHTHSHKADEPCLRSHVFVTVYYYINYPAHLSQPRFFELWISRPQLIEVTCDWPDGPSWADVKSPKLSNSLTSYSYLVFVSYRYFHSFNFIRSKRIDKSIDLRHPPSNVYKNPSIHPSPKKYHRISRSLKLKTARHHDSFSFLSRRASCSSIKPHNSHAYPIINMDLARSK